MSSWVGKSTQGALLLLMGIDAYQLKFQHWGFVVTKEAY